MYNFVAGDHNNLQDIDQPDIKFSLEVKSIS